MIHPGRWLLKAWFELLNGNVFNAETQLPVYRTDADSAEDGHYILIRMESSSTDSNNHEFITRPVVIIEVVTRFENKIDDSVVFEIQSGIDKLVLPTTQSHGLNINNQFQITSVTKQTETVIAEDDGAQPKINRLISRYLHRVVTPADLIT